MLLYDPAIFGINQYSLRITQSITYEKYFDNEVKEVWEIIPDKYDIAGSNTLRGEVELKYVCILARAKLISSEVRLIRNGIFLGEQKIRQEGVEDTIFLRCGTKTLADIPQSWYSNVTAAKTQLLINKLLQNKSR
jgi:hypothetical protein